MASPGVTNPVTYGSQAGNGPGVPGENAHAASEGIQAKMRAQWNQVFWASQPEQPRCVCTSLPILIIGTNFTAPRLWPGPCVMDPPVCVITSGLPCAGHKLVTGPCPPLCQVPEPELGRRGMHSSSSLPDCGLDGTLSCQLEKSLPCRLVLRVRGQALKTAQRKCSCLLAGRSEVLRGQYTGPRAVSTGRQHVKLSIEDE